MVTPKHAALVLSDGSVVTRSVVVALLLLALAVGLYARWHDLGGAPLSEDEYYSVRSVEFILDSGIPEFPSGGYYMRAPILQYAMAGAAELFGEDPFSYRLPSVLFSLISVLLTYLYASRFVSRPVALALTAVLLISSWQIEFARFARMYALFQCTTLLFLLFFDDALFRGRWNRRYWPHAAVLAATLSHQLGLLLAPLLFLPLITPPLQARFPNARRWLSYAVVSLLVTLACLVLVQTDWRNIGVSTPGLPADYEAPPALRSALVMPSFPFWQLPGDPWTTLGLLVAATLTAFGLAMSRLGRPVRAIDVLAGLLVLFSLVHLFVICAAIGAILLLRYDVWRIRLHPKRVYALVGLAVAIWCGWFAYGLAHPDSLLTPVVTLRWDLAEAGLLKSLWTTFLGWPDVYSLTVRPFALEMPMIGLLGFAALAWAVFAHRHASIPFLLRHPGFILIYTMICFGVLSAQWSFLRYWFHLYPIWLCVIALMAEELAASGFRRWAAARQHAIPAVAASSFLLLFAASGDFNPRHLWNVGSEQTAFRTGPFQRHEMLWYPRLDVASVGEFVNTTVDASDGSRIVIENLPAAAYYVHPNHAMYYIPQGQRFREISRERGTRDIWSGERVVSTREELAEYTSSARDVWLIRETERFKLLPEPEQVWGQRLLDRSQAYVSRDGRIEVLHLKLAPPAKQAQDAPS